jgi:hypothetical protein
LEYWENPFVFGLTHYSIVPLFHYSMLFGATGGATGGCAASAGGACSAFELAAAGEGKSRHDPADLLALALRTIDLFGRIEDQFFKIIIALVAVIFINGHRYISLTVESRAQRVAQYH